MPINAKVLSLPGTLGIAVPFELPPLLPTHFALPAEHQCGQLRRGGAAGQFGDLVHCAHWHLKRLGLAPRCFDGRPRALELLAPPAVAQALLVGLGAAGLPPDRAAATAAIC